MVFFVTVPLTDSGVGAGIDSYYEYLMKAYILLGDDQFLQRFNTVSITHYFVKVIIISFSAYVTKPSYFSSPFL